MEQQDNFEENKNQQNPLLIPFAILIAGVIIAAAVIFAFGNRQSQSATEFYNQQTNVRSGTVDK